MEYEILLKFLKHLMILSEQACRDGSITDVEIESLNNEIILFKKYIDSDSRIKAEFKQKIYGLFFDSDTKPEVDFPEKLMKFFLPNDYDQTFGDLNLIFGLNVLRDRLNNLLHTISRDEVYI